MRQLFLMTVCGAMMASPTFAGVFAKKGQKLGKQQDSLHLEQLPTRLSPTLIGGDVIDGTEYPGVFYTSQGGSRCTGTLVGERVVATAAHCVRNGGTLTLRYQGRTYSGQCTHHKYYRYNATADWALCLLSQPIPDAIAETVNTEVSRLRVGNELTLMGYGCIQPGGGGGNDGRLRIGSAPITRLPRGSNYDIITAGRSALCYGDSGGPSFVTDTATGKRYQTAINSRGDIRRTSYLSALHVDTAQAFYKWFGDQNGTTICGIHDNATGCLESSEPAPAECANVSDSLAVVSGCTKTSSTTDLGVCHDAIDNVRACVDAVGSN